MYCTVGHAVFGGGVAAAVSPSCLLLAEGYGVICVTFKPLAKKAGQVNLIPRMELRESIGESIMLYMLADYGIGHCSLLPQPQAIATHRAVRY